MFYNGLPPIVFRAVYARFARKACRMNANVVQLLCGFSDAVVRVLYKGFSRSNRELQGKRRMDIGTRNSNFGTRNGVKHKK